MEQYAWTLAIIVCILLVYLLSVICIQLTFDTINNIRYSRVKKQIEELESKLSKFYFDINIILKYNRGVFIKLDTPFLF